MPEKRKMSETLKNDVKHVLFVIAMEAEAKPFLDHLSLKLIEHDHKSLSLQLFQGVYKENMKITVAVNGKCNRFNVDNVGTTPAALSTYLAINHVKPDLIINAGTAGGFKSKGADIGDVFLSSNFKHHDRRIPIPGFTEYGVGDHDSILTPKLAEYLKAKVGVITTSNSLDHNETDDQIMLDHNASVKDMEAAAVAWVAEQTSTPCFGLKVVTDIVDGDKPTSEEFLENLSSAAKNLQETLPKVVDFIVGKTIHEL